ncbi:MAG: LacI family DNA-binding transcriptional regulator [Thermoclostridium sp.]|nr:LacI family DNA-binding transcriptional regulator [Thermoclostridium sp.]
MKEDKTHVNIRQIADRLHLSSGTVSIVLNGRGEQFRISKETQKRVHEMAKEMNYQPNIYARRFRKTAEVDTPFIIAVFWRTEFLVDLAGLFLQGLYQTIKEEGFNIELVIQPYDFGKLEKYKNLISNHHFNGAIIGGISDEDQTFLEQNDFNIPIVLIGRKTQKYNSVMIDDYDAGASCANLFEARNHLTAGLVGIYNKGRSAQLIELGFKETCSKKNIQIKEQWIFYCKQRDFKCGYDAAIQILSQQEKPSSLFVMDNRNAGGVFMACRTLGIHVPDDIEIMVYGENEYFSYSNPTVSSIQQPIVQYAAVSLKMIMTLINNQVVFPIMQQLTPTMNIRESCGGLQT